MMMCAQHLPRFDTVAVMDAGRVVEVGSPSQLLSKPSSRLAHLVACAMHAADTGVAW